MSAANIVGTLEHRVGGHSVSYADVTGLVMALGSVGGAAGLSAPSPASFAGDQLLIAQPARIPKAVLNAV